MSRTLLVCLCFVGLTGCAGNNSPATPKVIVDKMQTTEQRIGIDFFDSSNSVRTRATTVFYLVADDGTVAEVRMKDYLAVKKGDEYQTSHWRKP